jgi:hypothetical protein
LDGGANPTRAASVPEGSKRVAHVPRVSAGGTQSLHDNVTRRGGPRRWAADLGIHYVEHRPGYAPRWTEDRIREELPDYLAGRQLWPACEQFERDGRKLLRDAINRTGGSDRWAAEFRLPPPNRLSGIRRAWTPEIVEAQLRRLIGGRKEWPSRQGTTASARPYNRSAAASAWPTNPPSSAPTWPRPGSRRPAGD